MPPPEEGAISVAFVRPSVCPSVAYMANNFRTQRPSMRKFGMKVPYLRCDSHTSFKIKRSKVRVTRPINADTHRAPYLQNGRAYEPQTWYIDGGQDPHQPQGPWPPCSKFMVTWSVWGQCPINRKRTAVVSPKLARGYPMTRATLRTSFKVKSQGYRPSNADRQNVPNLPNGKA